MRMAPHSPSSSPAPADTLRVLGVFEDPTGALWFGSDSQGVVRLESGAATGLHDA